MTSPISIIKRVDFARGTKGRKTLYVAPKGQQTPPKGLLRPARLLALAHRFEELVRLGKAASYAELARAGGVSRARLTQIMNFLNLSLSAQEQIMFGGPENQKSLSRDQKGKDAGL
jgi:hypothetical protein